MTKNVLVIVIVATVIVASLLNGIQQSDSSNDSTRESTTHILSKHEREVDLASAANTTNNTTCPPWFIPDSNSTTGCKCGSTRENIVKCDNVSQRSYLFQCYCMTYNQDIQVAVVAHSFFGCLLQTEPNTFYIPLTSTIPKLNELMCGHANREGQLCGRCKDGFAVPIYSYDLSCVRCSEHTTNWVKYIAVAFLPLTAFLVIVIVFRISACSAHLNGFVLVSQIIAAPQQMRLFATHAKLPKFGRIQFVGALSSLYGIWNLDFFRLLYSPFCLYSNMTILEALAFDYIIAVYPLALIAIMYLLIKLHDHNFRPVVWLWKPFHLCTARFRRQLDIRMSLVDAYATFFLLSYVKILSVSFDILLSNKLIDIHGHTLDKYYLYYDGTVEFLGETHRPYAILAIAVLVVFIFSPLLLLIVYQCRCFHRCTQHCGFTCNILHTFMDAFQGCYKDGTNGTRDCRYFPIVYLILRILVVVAYVITRSDVFYQVAGVLWIITAFLVSMVRPYKVDVYTTFDTFLLTCSAAGYMLTLLADIGSADETILVKTSAIAISVLVMTPLLYIMARVIHWFLGQTRIAAFLGKLRAMLSNQETPSLEGSLPHRMTHQDEYTPLTATAENESRQWTENTAYGV